MTGCLHTDRSIGPSIGARAPNFPCGENRRTLRLLWIFSSPSTCWGGGGGILSTTPFTFQNLCPASENTSNYPSQMTVRIFKTSQQKSPAQYALQAHTTVKTNGKLTGKGPQLISAIPGRHGALGKFRGWLQDPQGPCGVRHPAQKSAGARRCPNSPGSLWGSPPQQESQQEVTRALGTGASPQLAAWPSASPHPRFSLGGLSRFCFPFSPLLCHSLSGEKKSPKVSNCKQTKSPYLFILSVSTVLGLVLPGILNRLPLLSGVHSGLLPLTSPGLSRRERRALPPPRPHAPLGHPRAGERPKKNFANPPPCPPPGRDGAGGA